MLNKQELAIERRVLKQVRDELAQQALYEEAQGDRAQAARDIAQDYLQEDEDGQYLDYPDMTKVLKAVIDDLFLLGPLEELLWDPDVSDIDINAPDNVRVEVDGVMHGTKIRFEDDDHVKAVIDRITSEAGTRCDEGQTMCNCVIHRPGAPFDGARVNITCMPTAVDHHEISIRKFKQSNATLQDLMETGMFDLRILEILEAILVGRMNFLIVGGTGTGKTTLLNALCRLIPRDQRVGILEDTPEIRFEHPDVFRNQARPANAEGEGEVTIRDLVINSLRKRPDRIIVGECRGPEASTCSARSRPGTSGPSRPSTPTTPAAPCRRFSTWSSRPAWAWRPRTSSTTSRDASTSSSQSSAAPTGSVASPRTPRSRGWRGIRCAWAR